MLQSTGSFFFFTGKSKASAKPNVIRSHADLEGRSKGLEKAFFQKTRRPVAALSEFEKRFAPFKVTICAPCEGFFLKKAV